MTIDQRSSTMISNADIEALMDVIKDVYHEPETRKEKLSAPEPYEVELEEEVLVDKKIEETEEELVRTSKIATIITSVIGVTTSAAAVIAVALEAVQLVQYIIPAGLIIAVVVFKVLKPREYSKQDVPKTKVIQVSEIRKIKVTIGEEDYPQKDVVISTVRWNKGECFADTETITIDVDNEYAPQYKETTIPNNEKIVSLGRFDIKIEALDLREGTLLLSELDYGEGKEIPFPCLNRGGEASNTLEELSKIVKKVPAVLSGERDIEKLQIESSYSNGAVLRGEELSILDSFKEIESIYRSIKHEKLSLNVLSPRHPIVNFIIPFNDANESNSLANQAVTHLIHLLDMAKKQNLEEKGINFVTTWKHNSLILTGVRFESLQRQIAPLMLEFGVVSHYTSFNFYCPYCHEEIIKSMLDRDYSVSSGAETSPVYFSPNSRCVYNRESYKWRCPVCEQEVDKPIPIHKVLNEVLYPTYDRLMEENKKARFDLDNKTKDDELKYKNQMDREISDASRVATQERNESLSKIEFLQAEIDGYLGAIKSLQGVAQEYEGEHSVILSEIDSFNRTIIETVQERTNSTLVELETSFQNSMMEYRNTMDRLSLAKRKEDMVRDAIQIDILQQMHRTATATEKSAVHLENIEGYSERTANATESTAKSTRKAAAHLERIEGHTAATAQHTKSISGGMKQLSQHMEQGNAIQTAMAKKQGVNIHDYSILRIDKNAPKLFANVGSWLLGESSIERAKRVGRAVK